MENRTLWLTQAQMAELFHTSVRNINLHLKAIYEEGEIAQETTINSHLIVRSEGGDGPTPERARSLRRSMMLSAWITRRKVHRFRPTPPRIRAPHASC